MGARRVVGSDGWWVGGLVLFAAVAVGKEDSNAARPTISIVVELRGRVLPRQRKEARPRGAFNRHLPALAVLASDECRLKFCAHIAIAIARVGHCSQVEDEAAEVEGERDAEE